MSIFVACLCSSTTISRWRCRKTKKRSRAQLCFFMTQKAYLMVGYYQMFEKDGIEIGYEG